METDWRGSTLLRKTPYNLYLAPHPVLRPYISNYTVSFPQPGMVADTLTILPDASGCIVSVFDGSRLTTTLWGPSTRPNQVDSTSNGCPFMVFVEFNPYGLYPFLPTGQAALADCLIPLEDLDPALSSSIQNILESVSAVPVLVDRLDRLFLDRLTINHPPALLFSCLDLIKSTGGQLLVNDLSARENYSERHLNRLFQQHIGMSPKLLLRLVRLNHAVRLLQKPDLTLLNIALRTGFVDESHLIHEFKDLYGLPLQHVRRNMSDFYNETLKL
jgi:AraC-like DNA-binding protein